MRALALGQAWWEGLAVHGFLQGWDYHSTMHRCGNENSSRASNRKASSSGHANKDPVCLPSLAASAGNTRCPPGHSQEPSTHLSPYTTRSRLTRATDHVAWSWGAGRGRFAEENCGHIPRSEEGRCQCSRTTVSCHLSWPHSWGCTAGFSENLPDHVPCLPHSTGHNPGPRRPGICWPKLSPGGLWI